MSNKRLVDKDFANNVLYAYLPVQLFVFDHYYVFACLKTGTLKNSAIRKN